MSMKDQKESLDVLGYCAIPGFLQGDDLQRARDLLTQSLEDEKDSFYPGYSDVRPDDPQVFNLHNKNKFFLDIFEHPELEEILRYKLQDEFYTALPDDIPNYILGEYIARTSGAPLRMHIDSWIPARGDYCWMMQCAIVLQDRGEAEGCTLVVPGSHQSGQFTIRDFKDATKLPASAGDLLIWDSRLWHGALPAEEPGKAWALIATFQRWWVKQRFDIPRSLTQDYFDSLSDKQKVLLGFASIPYRDEKEGTNFRGGLERLTEADDFLKR